MILNTIYIRGIPAPTTVAPLAPPAMVVMVVMMVMVLGIIEHSPDVDLDLVINGRG